MAHLPPPCIVLAGGLGTRLRSVVADVPKCLAPVAGRTFIDLLLDRLCEAGITQAVLSLGHGAEQVNAAVVARTHRTAPAAAESPSAPAVAPTAMHAAPAPVVRCVVEPAVLGTGGAIAFAMDALGLDDALVTNGDTFLDGDLSSMFDPLDGARGELFRMAVVEVPDRTRYGGVVADSDGRVQRFVEKGAGGPGAINAGLYRLARAALPVARAGAYSLESEVLPQLAAAGAVRARPIDGSFIDIGVPDDYFRFCARYLG